MTLLRLLLLALAAFRLTILISKDKGPANIMLKLRRKTPKKGHLDEGVKCPWCVSVWVGALLATGELAIRGTYAFEAPLLALAISGAALILNQAFTKE